MTKKNEIGYELLDLIATAKEYVPEMSLVHAETFLSMHAFESSFEEVVEQLIDSGTAIPSPLFERINVIGIYLGMQRNIWASLES
jgi:hypothetical protein